MNDTIKCHKCGATPNEVRGWLQRVVKGESEWECRPFCGCDISRDEAILGAIETKEEPQ